MNIKTNKPEGTFNVYEVKLVYILNMSGQNFAHFHKIGNYKIT